MAAAGRAWISVAAVLMSAARLSIAPVLAQGGGAHTHLIPLPHPEILHPNDPDLPPSVLHPHVYRAPPHHLPRHQHLIPLPHPELVHPRPQAFETFRYSGSGFVMTETLQADAGQPPAATPKPDDAVVDSPRDIAPRIVTCWNPPPLGGDPTHQITVRMEFARDGSIFGKPLVTYVAAGSGGDARQAMADSIQAALRQCTPLHFTPRLGADMAGYPIIIRFIQTSDDTNNYQH